MSNVNITTLTSPFGGEARHIRNAPTGYIIELYKTKCGVDVTLNFRGRTSVDLYECEQTGYQFWRPENIAGGDELYHALNAAWPYYYRTSRWEYSLAKNALRDATRILEIGCGRGYFLQSLQPLKVDAIGLELNRKAIQDKVTQFPIKEMTVEELADTHCAQFDAICTFQVLEHIADPASFLNAASKLLCPGGLLLISTPNRAYHALTCPEDAFDLPPHHMGHFDDSCYKKIAALLGFTIARIYFQPREFEPLMISASHKWHLSVRAAQVIARLAYNFAFRKSGEPGPNLLVILRKP